MNQFSRNIGLIGELGQSRLEKANVLIVGIGGVGGYVLEMLVRAGIKNFTLVDGDNVEMSNLNRQIISLSENIGQPKVNVAKQRAIQINSTANISVFNSRYNLETSKDIFSSNFDYAIDCFDSVKDKIHFIITAKEKNIPTISAMGAGNRLNPDFKVMDIYKTCYDRLARTIRSQLKKMEVKSLKVVAANTPPEIECCNSDNIDNAKNNTEHVISSISYAPAIMGCLIASEVIKDLIK